MKELFRNPHTFDMSNYYTGDVFVVGGRDFENEDEKEPFLKHLLNQSKAQPEKKKPIELDWSFLKKKRNNRS